MECQITANEVLRLSNDGINKLATNIPKFKELGLLKFGYSQIANENENLSILKANNAKYHNTCNRATVKVNLKLK